MTSRCGESTNFQTRKVDNTSVVPKPTCRGWVSINGLKGKRDEWAASRTKISSGKPGVTGIYVETDSWLFQAFKEDLDVEEAGADEEDEEDEENLGPESWDEEKTAVGTSTTAAAILAMVVTGICIWRRRKGVEERRESDTYVGYQDNKSNSFRVFFGEKLRGGVSDRAEPRTEWATEENAKHESGMKDDPQIDVATELNNIGQLTEGMEREWLP